MRKLLALLVACAAACNTPDFQAASNVSDLRVLSIVSDPAEVQFDDTGVESVTVTALIRDPHERAPATVQARLCAPTDSRRCEGPQLAIPTQQHDLSTHFTWTLQVPPQVIAAALQADDLKGLNGVRVMFAIDVDDGDPHGVVSAEKILVFNRRSPQRNHNPQLTGLRLSRLGTPLGDVQSGSALSLTAGADTGLRPLLAADARETYQTVDLQGRTVQLTEDPAYNFYIEGNGDVGDGANEPVDGVAPSDGLVRLTPYGRGSGVLWVVVRDGRGGESFTRFDWTAQ